MFDVRPHFCIPSTLVRKAFLRQEANQYLDVPPSVACTLPVELQELIGYSMPGSALGYYDDFKSPKEALRAAAEDGEPFPGESRPLNWATKHLPAFSSQPTSRTARL